MCAQYDVPRGGRTLERAAESRTATSLAKAVRVTRTGPQGVHPHCAPSKQLSASWRGVGWGATPPPPSDLDFIAGKNEL